ncbi:MAG: addiction module protein [Candidatus Ruthia sp.]|jgi:putative addiction module component (TIGR02574 family)|nr:addiction module protein [Candidatus Ruthturnera sp.]MBT4667967.1 addiction module protein [Candidatus Ruthturnera sp.]MBT5236257.1 addiction module protein [Candidatus Neomarinimicrobiota bacterium]
MTITEITKMSAAERLQTMETIWDSFSHDQIEIKSPEWHKDVLSERREKIEQGQAEFISFSDLKSRS